MTPTYSGQWTLARTIHDRERETQIVCTGTARLRPDNNWLVYDEDVWFRLAEKQMRATRAYRFASSDDQIVATFSDGAPFFELRLNAQGVGTATHTCRDDLYALTLTLSERTAWETRWEISGTKHLVIVTRYTR